jgi:hypothetical protein
MTDRDNILAAAAHAAITVPLLGTVVPLVIWSTRGRKSPIVASQALQALVYQVISFLGGCVVLGPLACIFCFAVICNGESPPPDASFEPPFPDDFLLFVLELVLVYLLVVGLYSFVGTFTVVGLLTWLGYIVYGLYGALTNLRGADFAYPIIGPRLKRYLVSARG